MFGQQISGYTSQTHYSETSATPTEQQSSAIARNFGDAEKAASAIATLIDQIENRASAILRPVGPEQNQGASTSPTQSPLADAVGSLTRDLVRSAARLQALLLRIDL